MVSSSSAAAALAVLPFPSSSSSDESDDTKAPAPLPPHATEAASPPPPQQQHQQRWQSLERDCNVLMKALARAGDVDRVVEVFAELRRSASSAGVAPNVLCFNTLLNALVGARPAAEVRAAFDEMLGAGVAPNASTLNILVKLHAWHSADFEQAYKMMLVMQGLGVEADADTYSTLITGLCRAGRVTEAFGVLDRMVEVGCLPMVHTYTPIVQGYCREGRIEDAKELIAVMESVGCPPNVVTYNILIKALCDHARFDEVEQILKDSRTKGWKPSAVTYNTYTNGLYKKGMVKEALEVLNVMRGEGLDPTAFTWSISLNCLCHDSRISDAISLLASGTALTWHADVTAYNTVMSRLCDLGRWRGVLELLTDMIKKGINPNMRTFNILIHSLCIGGKSSTAKNLVCNRVFAANVVTYNTLIHWFYYRGKINEAEHLFLDMRLLKISPDEATYTVRVDGLCSQRRFEEAVSSFVESLDFLESSRDCLSVLINRLVHSHKIREINRVFTEMDGKGFLPDYSVFDHTIRCFCKTGYCHEKEIFRLNNILDTMLGSKPSPCSSRKEINVCREDENSGITFSE
ncbi:hypothetical protein ACP70R_026324 [Stipagrostis hirtigluma subsp. patula]